MDQGWKEREGALLVVVDVGISRWKSIPLHNLEKMDEEVCLSIHQLQLIPLLLSAIQISPTSESQDFFWLIFLFQTMYLNYLLPALTLHSYYHLPLSCCDQVLGPLLPNIDCHRPFQPQMSLHFQHAERRFPPQLSQFIPRSNQSLQFLQKNKSPPWSWCLYIVTMLFLTVLLCSECFPPHCSCKCGPSCNDAAHRKTPFFCDLRQPLELIPGKSFLAFLSYAFLWTDGQSDGWRGEEQNNDWERVVQWLGAHQKFRKIVCPMHFPLLCCCLHCSSLSRVDILFSVLLPFPTAKQLHCSALLLAVVTFEAIEYSSNGILS